MKGLFSGCSSLISIDVSNFDTSKVTNMNSMFSGCIKITSLNLNNFNTNLLIDIKYMFKRCLSLISLDLSSFNTLSVSDMEGTFSECAALTYIDINNFKSRSIETMAYMFSGCKLLRTLKFPILISSTLKNVSHMFSDCSSLNSLDLSKFISSKLICTDYMFSGCRFLNSLNLNNFNTQKVTDMKYMFAGCSSLKQINLGSIKTENVVYMNGLFYGCEALEELDISHFDTSLVEKMSFMFYHLKSIKSLNIPNFNTEKVEYMNYMFKDCEALTSLEISNFNVLNIKNFDGMFSGCSKLISLNIPNFDTKNAITMDDMFNGCSSLISLDISNFDTSKTTSIKKMFFECKSLTTLDISNFDTSLISTLEYFFYGCSELKEISLSNFNTSLVTSVAYMFNGCSSLISIDLRNFNTSKINTMEYMFYGCSSLKDININNFDTTSVTNMAHMLEKCTSLTTIDLSNFDTHSTESIEYMFADDFNLVYINFTNYDESNMKKINNIFQGTLENMVYCFNASELTMLRILVENKGCSIIDCSDVPISKRKKVIATTNQCVDKCPDEALFLFDYKCHFRCPGDTYPENFICKMPSDDNNNNTNSSIECDIKEYFMGYCKKTFVDSKEKRKFIEKTVSKMVRSELYDIVLRAIDNNYNSVVREGNEVYQIYALKNKNRDNNLTYIDFSECGVKLKQNNRMTEDDDIIVFKIEYTSPDFKIPIIEYALFGVYGTKRNLNACNNMKINYYIPKTINNYEDYKYNPENNYYNDGCKPSVSENRTDLTLKERMDLFNENNMSLCESMCTFKGYEYNNIICECGIKTKFNSFLNVNVSKYNLIYRFDQTQLSNINLWVIKCFFNLFTKDAIKKNICSLIILGILFVSFISAIIFFIKEHDLLKKKIFMFKESILKKEELNDSMDIINNSNSGNVESDISQIKFELEPRKSSARMLNKNNKKHKHDNNIYKNIYNKNKLIIKLKKMKEYLEYTDNELNNLSYSDAILFDKRSFFKIYFSLIKTKQILIFVLNCKNDFNPRSMKISFMFSIFAIFLACNTIFVTDLTLHNLYISEGRIEIFSNITKILFSVLISTTIKNILLLVCFPEKDILKIRKSGIQKIHKKNPAVQKSLTMVVIKCYIFFFISFIILSFIWIYVFSFFIIFENTQMYVIQNTIISFGISIFAPFILYIIPAIIRNISVKSDGAHGNYCLYAIAKILQIIV